MATNFGSGIDGYTDLPLVFTLATGLRNVANCIARRLQTPRGNMFWAPNDGLDLRQYVNGNLTAAQLAALEAAINAECEKDERVLSCDATVTGSFQTSTMTVQIALTLAEGPFTLVLSVNSLTVELLESVPQ